MDNKTKIPSKAPPELLTDRFGRRLNYLRVSVTDRCNQRCAYCAPYSEKFKNREDILSFDEITRLVSLMVSMGVEKVRLTGGEPLVRKDVTDLVSMLKDAGVKDLSMTTNAVLLERFASTLTLNGLNRINVSLDSLNPEKFKLISGGGDIVPVLRGIEAALGVQHHHLLAVAQHFDGGPLGLIVPAGHGGEGLGDQRVRANLHP